MTAFLLADAATADAGGMGMIGMIVYVVVIMALMYFIAIRPQKKQQKQQQAMIASMEIGDSIMTTGGFYGVVIDITDDVVIVEFGSNKNCRIPMEKAAVAKVEKANA
ncbi:MAG: preprotein translocase subunit YajC [Lachnospiraceae bacterium]|nr:preprotein translocase subunit YajC [Lachnospiraceae bacterium]